MGMELGMTTVTAVTVLAYLLGAGVKASPLDSKWIPVICGCAGAALGVAAFYLGMAGFPGTDPLTAAAVGAASGLAATGLDQAVKQMRK